MPPRRPGGRAWRHEPWQPGRPVRGGRGQLAEAEQQLAEARPLDEGYAQAAAAEQQLAEGKAALDEGYARAAEAEQQLAEGERKLAEGKAALDEGYAQLAEGGSQIAEGRQQLSDAHELLEEGGNPEAGNREKLEEGREMLEGEPGEALNDSLSALDRLSDEMERLKQGLRLLKAEKGLKDRLSGTPAPLEVLDIAEGYYRELLRDLEEENTASRLSAILLGLAGLAGTLGLLLSLRREDRRLTAPILCALSGLLSLLALLFWRSRCPMLEGLLPHAALALTICAALYAELLFRRRRAAAPERLS